MAIPAPVMPVPVAQFFDNNGDVLAGGLLWSYLAGTTTPQPTYSDSLLTQPNTNPIVLDSSGRAVVYLSAVSYKFDLQDKNGVSMRGYPQDNIADYGELLGVLSGLMFPTGAIVGTTDVQTLTNKTLTAPVIGTSVSSTSALWNQIADGRLTLTTAVPVTSADVLAATTIYYSPYGGNNLALYDGSTKWTVQPFAELSIAVPAVANQCYDVFAYSNAGVATLEVLAWTSDSARATALVLQDGVWVKTGATTRRYLGTFRTTTVAGQTEDSLLKRYVWNYAHRVERPLQRIEPTASWTYNTNTIRQANGSTSNQVEVVIGLSEDPILVDLAVSAFQATATNNLAIGVGLDSTTTFASNQTVTVVDFAAGIAGILKAQYRGYPGIGRHVLSWNEVAMTNLTTTFYGTAATINTITLAASTASGLLGYMKG